MECLAKEIYKFLNGLSPPIMNGAFMIRNNNCNLRNFQCLYSTNKRTVKHGTETVTYRGPQIRNLVPEKTKSASFDIFRKLENARAKSVHVEYVKRTFNMYGYLKELHTQPILFLYTFIYIFIMLFIGGGGVVDFD